MHGSRPTLGFCDLGFRPRHNAQGQTSNFQGIPKNQARRKSDRGLTKVCFCANYEQPYVYSQIKAKYADFSEQHVASVRTRSAEDRIGSFTTIGSLDVPSAAVKWVGALTLSGAKEEVEKALFVALRISSADVKEVKLSTEESHEMEELFRLTTTWEFAGYDGAEERDDREGVGLSNLDGLINKSTEETTEDWEFCRFSVWSFKFSRISLSLSRLFRMCAVVKA